MSINTYVQMLDGVYLNGTNNHPEHNSNPDYWDILLGDLKKNKEKFANKKALDFGCGKGRNVSNMISLCDFESVDGVDLSQNNIDFCNRNKNIKSTFYKNNGLDLSCITEEEKYDFIMSTIVLQHICVYELRYKILQEIFRLLKKGGIFSFQMGYGDSNTYEKDAKITDYYDNNYFAINSNGTHDVRVTSPSQLIKDLTNIGFIDVVYDIKASWEDGGHLEWIYVKAKK